MKVLQIKPSYCLLIFSVINLIGHSQSVKRGDLMVNVNYGVPHLYKGIVSVVTSSDQFKNQFDGTVVLSPITGMNPISFKAEFGITKWLSLGLSGAFWTIKFGVTDNYNVLHAGQVTGSDETDTYKFRISSTSFGIRPNFHIPLESRKHDLYVGMAFGITQNKLNIDFSSTDVNKVYPNFNYDLSLPGGTYLAPTLGYRYYPSEYVGANFEIGYEKGALLQAGVIVRFNVLGKPRHGGVN
jgi:hypothetical protein